jgi:hypothetical protein
MRPYIRNFEHFFILGRNTWLGHLVGCQAPKLAGNVWAPSERWKRNGVDWRALPFGHLVCNPMNIPQSSLMVAKLRLMRIEFCWNWYQLYKQNAWKKGCWTHLARWPSCRHHKVHQSFLGSIHNHSRTYSHALRWDACEESFECRGHANSRILNEKLQISVTGLTLACTPCFWHWVEGEGVGHF